VRRRCGRNGLNPKTTIIVIAVQTLHVDRADGVVTITLSRPEKKNAVTVQMIDEIMEAVAEVARRADDRVLVLTGAGDAFCSGADLSQPSSNEGGPLGYMRRVGESVVALHNLPKPTIAKVNGVAVGLGCNYALGCDLVVAAESARFSQIFARRGLSVDGGGTWLLPRLVGLHRAKELAFFADIVSAEEAREFGFVNRVVPDDQLDKAVDEWAARLAAGPPTALSMTKTMLNNAFAVSMAQAVEDEARCQVVNMGTADMAEAIQAFLQKREPRFTGR
jgi:enoyl-CoA hydratase/carnithine racemase